MTLRNLASRIRDRARLPRNEDGSVAIEFAFIAPVLLIMYFGLFQISMVIMEDRRVSHSASVLGDLVTREDTLDKDAVENIFQGAAEVLGMSNLETLGSDVRMQVVSLRKVDDNPNGVTVIGSAEIGDTAGTTWPPICVGDIDNRLLNTSSGAIVARVGYNFSMASHADAATADSFNKDYIDPDNNGVNLQEQVIFKPRGPVDIPFVDSSGTLAADEDAHYNCDISSSGVVSCSNAVATVDTILTCNNGTSPTPGGGGGTGPGTSDPATGGSLQ